MSTNTLIPGVFFHNVLASPKIPRLPSKDHSSYWDGIYPVFSVVTTNCIAILGSPPTPIKSQHTFCERMEKNKFCLVHEMFFPAHDPPIHCSWCQNGSYFLVCCKKSVTLMDVSNMFRPIAGCRLHFTPLSSRVITIGPIIFISICAPDGIYIFTHFVDSPRPKTRTRPTIDHSHHDSLGFNSSSSFPSNPRSKSSFPIHPLSPVNSSFSPMISPSFSPGSPSFSPGSPSMAPPSPGSSLSPTDLLVEHAHDLRSIRVCACDCIRLPRAIGEEIYEQKDEKKKRKKKKQHKKFKEEEDIRDHSKDRRQFNRHSKVTSATSFRSIGAFDDEPELDFKSMFAEEKFHYVLLVCCSDTGMSFIYCVKVSSIAGKDV
ncbi:hypothetical protein ADUPG1_009823, partial [Aduncisulcus paluster]